MKGRELSDELGSTNYGEGTNLQFYLRSLVRSVVPGTSGFASLHQEGNRKVVTMISIWDEVDRQQLIIESLPRAENIMTSDTTENHKPFLSEMI
jgi:hypothetical protein